MYLVPDMKTLIYPMSFRAEYLILFLFLIICFAQDGWTALTHAATNGHLGVVVLLLDREANKEAATNVRRCSIYCF